MTTFSKFEQISGYYNLEKLIQKINHTTEL